MSRAILCPRCRRLIGSEEAVCSWCGTSRSAPVWKVLNWSKGALGSDRVVQAIISANLLYYALSIMIGRSGGFLSPGQTSLMMLGATGTVPIDYYGRFWTLITASYLHGGIIHLIFNLMALRQIAPWAANEFGTGRMFIIYTLGGVFGYLVSYLAGIPFTIGASAAICALVGALMYYGKSRGGGYGGTVFRELSGWVVSIFVFGLIFPGINNWGHGGGLVGGALLGMLLGYSEKRRETVFHQALAFVCLAATVVAIGWALKGMF